MTRRPCADALRQYGQSLNVKALTAELARIDDEREELIAALNDVRNGLEAEFGQGRARTNFPKMYAALAQAERGT